MFSLVEIFRSLQGEGRNAGRQAVFVRFAGCNFACPWCDTEHATRFTLSQKELLGEIATYGTKSVILTGGEPTLQTGMGELVKALKDAGYWVAIETNGSVGLDEAPWLDALDYIACSPKLEYPDAMKLTRADEVRLVVSEADAVVKFCRALTGRIAATDYYLSPCERDGKFDFPAVKDALSQLDGWALSVQLHKLLGFR